MKTLIVLRHAKSSWDDEGLRDFDRTLNARGMRAARTMGRHMHELNLSFDHVMASPAARVVATLDGLWEGYGHIPEVNWDPRIYLATGCTLLDLVREAPDAAGQVMLVGHSPGLEELILTLARDRDDAAPRREIEQKFPTAAFAEIAINVDRWADAGRDTGDITRFVRPRDVDSALGPQPNER